MAIRPIGKSTKLACFEKQVDESTFSSPTREIPFKSCDLKKVIKTEEDQSLVGEVFTTELYNTGYDITGNIEMNVYPTTIGDILFFTLGKSTKLTNTVSGSVIVYYAGSANLCGVSHNSNTLLFETSTNGSTWTTLLSIDTTNKTLSQIANEINATTSTTNLRAFSFGSGVIQDFVRLTIKEYNDSCNYAIRATSSLTGVYTHYIYASNDVFDSIPSFSALLNKGYGNNKCFGYVGCKINTTNLSFAVKTFVTCGISVRAKEEIVDQVDNSVDFSMIQPYVTNKTKIIIDGVNFTDVKDLKIDINNNMYLDEAIGINTYNAQDRQSGSISISGTANLTIDNTTVSSDYLNTSYTSGKAVSVTLLLEHDNNYFTLVSLPKVKLSDGTTTIGGPDRLTLSFAGQSVKSNLFRHIECLVNNNRSTDY